MEAAILALSFAPALALPPNTSAHDSIRALPPGTGTGMCSETAANYALSTDLQKTSAKRYKDVTGTTIGFTQGTTGCVEISFSAEAATVAGELMLTQALVDGTPCLPANNIFASDSPSSDLAVRTMNYICPNVSFGAHTAKMQFRSWFGGSVALDFRTTIVRYAP